MDYFVALVLRHPRPIGSGISFQDHNDAFLIELEHEVEGGSGFHSAHVAVPGGVDGE